MNHSYPKVSAIDLFCGAGGLTHGLINAGISVRAGFDVDECCRYPFEENNEIPFVCEDISVTTVETIRQYLGTSSVKLIAGCAPCQPFSRYTQGKNAQDSDKWRMLFEFMRLIEGVNPELVTMENVPQLRNHSIYKDFENLLIQNGYKISSSIVFAPNYGIPQTRNRLVLLASKFGEIKLIPPTHTVEEYKSVYEAIAHLKEIDAGRQCEFDPLHKASSLSALNLKRIKSSKPGGSWQDWSDALITDCHKKPEGISYKNVYGRMSWDKPSPTITTQFTGFGNGRFGHPDQNRALSLREGALLQTFPENYRFTSPNECVTIKNVARMIGNAVPVELARVIGLSIQRHLETQQNDTRI
ncbi:MAG: DNA cytosine methyltransferase [Alphaproteobacteria bacterium]|nr:DNA cytosine methyltransferase [Alphaproteobacteria bacterium]